MSFRDQHRMDTYFDSFRCVACHAEKFDHAAGFFCIADIGCGDLCNPFGINIVKGHTGIESDRRHDCYFSSGIQTFDVRGRIGLCIAKLCRQCQGFFEFHAVLCHFCQDKVRGSIDNSHDFTQMISGKALFERSDDRDRAGNRCFKQQIASAFLRLIHQFFSIGCDQVFICRHDLFSCLHRFHDIRSCRLHAAHYFDHDLNLVIVYDLLPAVCQHRGIFDFPGCFFQISHQDFLDLDLGTDLMLHFFFLHLQYFIYAESDGSKS